MVEVGLRDVTVLRDGRRVLDRITWRVRTGETWVVVGGNGAGKTQLLRLLAGQVWADSGLVEYQLGDECLPVPFEVLRHVSYLGPERQDRYERRGWDFSVSAVVATGIYGTDIPLERPTAADRVRVRRQLKALGLTALARRRFLSLSFGQRRLVLLARALVAEPGLLLLDELLAGLDAGHRQRVLRWMGSAAARRVGWVLSTHRPDEVPGLPARRVALRSGRRVRSPAVAASPTGAAPRSAACAASSEAGAGTPLLLLQRASVYLDYRPVLRQVSMRIDAGQCWVVHGPNGSGKTTLLRAVYGDWPFSSGSTVRRVAVERGVPLSAFRERCALLAPHQHAEYPRATSALDAVASGLRASYGLDGPVTVAERRRARQALRLAGMQRHGARTLATLSYGQVRRVLLARALVNRPQLLLLDEPFAGLDRAARSALQRALARFLGGGGALLLTTHHRDEWPAGTTHELHLDRGKVVYCGNARIA